MTNFIDVQVAEVTTALGKKVYLQEYKILYFREQKNVYFLEKTDDPAITKENVIKFMGTH